MKLIIAALLIAALTLGPLVGIAAAMAGLNEVATLLIVVFA
ncbi:hypothetical protein [Bradyrhizobium sp. SZCCHNRI2010]|nr:hypothetical protein [Bradyrhizobium sp. SZCCHNRI2010]